MAVLKLPVNVSSITISGTVYTPDGNGNITDNPGDETILVEPWSDVSLVYADLVTGNIQLQLSANVSSITINGIVYVPDGNQRIVIPPVDGTIVVRQRFQLVTG